MISITVSCHGLRYAMNVAECILCGQVEPAIVISAPNPFKGKECVFEKKKLSTNHIQWNY